MAQKNNHNGIDKKNHAAEYAGTIVLRGFYRHIMSKLWEDVENNVIPPILIAGISRDIRKILYGRS